MLKVILTKGLPGCGKTTWAKEQQRLSPGSYKRINKDDLRAMLDDSKHSDFNEGFVLAIRDHILIEALKQGKHVIIDDTNFNPVHEDRVRNLIKASQVEATVEIKDFTNVPLEECIRRDLKRANSVGEKVIRDMYRKYLKQPVPVVQYDPKLEDAIICDLDGTLALFGNANPYDRDFTKDQVNEPVRRTLISLGKTGMQIIFVSGRKDKFRDQTEQWLKEHWGPYYQLYMRKTLPDGERDPKDVVIKQEIYENNIKGKYNILLVLDDRNQVVEFWRSQGLVCFQVAEGDF